MFTSMEVLYDELLVVCEAARALLVLVLEVKDQYPTLSWNVRREPAAT